MGRSSVRRVDQEDMGNRSVYGGGSKEVKKERAKREMPSKLVARFKSCHGPSTSSRKGRGSPVGMTRLRWGNKTERECYWLVEGEGKFH